MPLLCCEPYACLIHPEYKILNSSHTLKSVVDQFLGDPHEWIIGETHLLVRPGYFKFWNRQKIVYA